MFYAHTSLQLPREKKQPLLSSLVFRAFPISILSLRNTISKRRGNKKKQKKTKPKNIKRGSKYKSHHSLSSEAIIASVQTIMEKDTWVGHLVALLTEN